MVWLLLCFVVSLCVFLFASLLYLYQRPAFVVPPVGIHPLKEPSTYDGADPSKFKAWILTSKKLFLPGVYLQIEKSLSQQATCKEMPSYGL